jgi:hypothetical protein
MRLISWTRYGKSRSLCGLYCTLQTPVVTMHLSQVLAIYVHDSRISPGVIYSVLSVYSVGWTARYQ